MHKLKIDEFVKCLGLTVVNPAEKEEIIIETTDINRPGLQFAGYFTHFAKERLQVIGNAEWSFLETLSDEEKDDIYQKYFSAEIPAILVARDLELPENMLKYARKYNRPIFKSKLPTTKFLTKLINYLDEELAPNTMMHGVLIDIFGVGTLITGKSGVGKSETALELVKRGHRLVADDAVYIKNIDDRLIGSAPDLMKHFLEIRGIGILDIKRLYGVGAIRNSKKIGLVVELEYWDENKVYDRLGIDEEFIDILGKNIPKITIPVKPGRNLAIILEVAAKNHRQKQMGYNAALELNKKLMEQMESKMK